MKIEKTLTTPGGCSIKIVGELSLTKNTFNGTVTVSGDKCPVQGTFEFNKAAAPSHPGGGLTVAFDTKDVAKLSKLIWSGDSKVTKMLNHKTVNSEMSDAIKSSVRASAAKD